MKGYKCFHHDCHNVVARWRDVCEPCALKKEREAQSTARWIAALVSFAALMFLGQLLVYAEKIIVLLEK